MFDIPKRPDFPKFDREIVLRSHAEWREFWHENAEAIIEQYGSDFSACLAAKQGGFTMGGGASPLTLIRFED